MYMNKRPSTVRHHTSQASMQATEMARQSDSTTKKRDQQSNNNQGTADSERAVDSKARGKQSKRQRDVATRKDIKKKIS